MRVWAKSILVWLLMAEARAVLRRYNPKVVAVTGSVGKTSTKDAVYAVISQAYHVRKSEKSFNSEIGLPLTILGRPNAWQNPLGWIANLFDGFLLVLINAAYPEWLVLEVGADRPGDISSLSDWLKTDVAVITHLPEVPVHVEFFDSVEAVIEEKASLIDTLRPGGALLLYADDERTLILQERLPAPDARILTFGFNPKADVRGVEFEIVRDGEKPLGMRGVIEARSARIPATIMGALGSHAYLPLIAAAAVGVALGVSEEQIAQGLARYAPAPGRMRLLDGIKGTTIIDDTYNSSPAAAHAALKTLGHLGRRRIAVMGDMLELGRMSVEEHRKVGAEAAKCCDLFVTVGFRARDMAQSALDNGLRDDQVLQYEDSQRAGEELQNLLQEGDVILIKGSQSMRMERTVEELMAEPSRAAELLVRQDREWKKR